MSRRALIRDAWPLVAAALALSACKKDGGTLVDIAAVEPGEECAAGGVRIETGIDENRDGTLDADEVTSSDVVCEGEEPPAQSGVATRTTELSEGDADCPYGGTRLDAGLDDGAGGGTAGDGVLQDGEVDASSFVCEPAPYTPEPVEPPSGPAGAFTITMPGGQGTHASGGEGGFLTAWLDSGTIGGGIRLYPTGAATSDLTWPNPIVTNLGPDPVEVTSNVTVLLDPTVSGLANGTLYVLTGDATLYVRDSAAGEGYRMASGLHVASGATLTLPDNDAADFRAMLQVSHDVRLAGTITTVREAGAAADLSIAMGNFVGETTGRVDLSGTDSTGADGGRFELDATFGWSFGSIFNQATIDVSGGDGASGGAAGPVDWYATLQAWNAGTIVGHGGAGTAGVGGDGSDNVYIEAFTGIYNDGSVDLSGGDGTLGGGDGGELRLDNTTGFLVDKGALDASGGSATACVATCSAGYGGGRSFTALGGAIVVTGALTAPGGDAPKLGGNVDPTYGGEGGYLYLSLGSTDGGWSAGYATLGDIRISGDIDLSGGSGGYGGDAGRIDVGGDYSNVPDDQQILLLGYTGIDQSGGAGATEGGNGGYVSLTTDYADIEFGPGSYGPGGAVANHVDIDLSGAAGATRGGRGGYFEAATDGYYGQFAPWEVVLNRGDVDASGGAGGIPGGPGYIYMFGSAGIENSGALSVDGGTGTLTGNLGSGAIELFAEEGPAIVGGTLSAVGGSTTSGTADPGGGIRIVGEGATVTATMTATGGAGQAVGGAGGEVYVMSLGAPSSVTGTIGVLGGTGTIAGTPGRVAIDGQNVTAQFVP